MHVGLGLEGQRHVELRPALAADQTPVAVEQRSSLALESDDRAREVLLGHEQVEILERPQHGRPVEQLGDDGSLE